MIAPTIVPFSAKDIPTISRVDSLCYTDYWYPDRFEKELSVVGCVPMACYFGARLVGYAIYQRSDSLLMRVGVIDSVRRKGVASALLNTIKLKINKADESISAVTTEDNIEGQLFLKSQDFRCYKIIPKGKLIDPVFNTPSKHPYYFFEYNPLKDVELSTDQRSLLHNRVKNLL